jgi:hypothetical protein
VNFFKKRGSHKSASFEGMGDKGAEADGRRSVFYTYILVCTHGHGSLFTGYKLYQSFSDL